jgi:predicted nucleic-acid-binding Zn-ribbon protein
MTDGRTGRIPSMRQSGKCPKCGSQNIVQNAKPVIFPHSTYELELAVYEKPEALLFKGEKERYTLGAWICKGCGYSELYSL